MTVNIQEMKKRLEAKRAEIQQNIAGLTQAHPPPEVEDALKRIEAGTYGRCTECGEQIPDKRLEAMPWVALCVKDEERLEQRNLSREELYDEDTV